MSLEQEVEGLGALVAERTRRTELAEAYIAVGNLQHAYGFYVDKPS